MTVAGGVRYLSQDTPFTNDERLSKPWPLLPCMVPGQFRMFPQPVSIDNADGPPYFAIFFPDPTPQLEASFTHRLQHAGRIFYKSP